MKFFLKLTVLFLFSSISLSSLTTQGAYGLEGEQRWISQYTPPNSSANGDLTQATRDNDNPMTSFAGLFDVSRAIGRESVVVGSVLACPVT